MFARDFIYFLTIKPSPKIKFLVTGLTTARLYANTLCKLYAQNVYVAFVFFSFEHFSHLFLIQHAP